MQNRECILFSSAYVIRNRESTSRVHACESRVHLALFTFAFAAFAYGCAFARWNFLAGLPRAETESHTHRIWSASFRLVVTWLTERKYVRTYASTDCTGRVGGLSKGREGCLRRVLANPHLLHWPFTIWSINSCQNRIATNQYHIAISRAHVSTHQVDFQKGPSSDFIWRGTKDFSYLIGANFTDPKTGRCAWTNQSSSQGPLGDKAVTHK